MKDKLLIVLSIVVIIVGIFISPLYSILKFNEGECSECSAKYDTDSFVADGYEWIKYECDNCGNDGYIKATYVY